MTTTLKTPGQNLVDNILSDPAASQWLKLSLQRALDRDPVNAASDAVVLSQTLQTLADEAIASVTEEPGA